MFRAVIAISVLAAALLGAGCARNPSAAATASGSSAAAARWPSSGDPGLEVVAWSTEADESVFARAIAPYSSLAGTPGGLSLESQAFLASHGLRVFAVPVDQLEPFRIALGAPPRHVNQWLGQAVVWTEAVSGPPQPRGQTIALESERLRLGPGRLRLLARAWISPAPHVSGGGGRAQSGEMTIELLPQHDEEGRVASHNPLVPPTSIAATEEGLLFTRLITRLSVRSSDTAIVLVGMPPGADIEQLARAAPATELRAITDGEAGAVPGVGQVVRQPGGGNGPQVDYETSAADAQTQLQLGGPVGPAAARLPTIGEAILSPHVWAAPRRAPGRQNPAADTRPVLTIPRRMVVALVPRLPERVQMLP